MTRQALSVLASAIVAFLIGSAGTAEEPAAEGAAKACDSGDARACSSLARRYGFGLGVEQDAAKVVELNQKACAGGDGAGCEVLAWLHKFGRVVQKDQAKASTFAERAVALYEEQCGSGDGHACVRAGRLRQAAKVAGVECREHPGSREALTQLWRKGCDLGEASACDDLWATLDRPYGSNNDKAQVRAQCLEAITQTQPACDRGEGPACFKLAAALEHTGGIVRLSVTQDSEGKLTGATTEGPRGNVPALRKACDLGESAACVKLGTRLLYEHGNADAALPILEKECTRGNGEACTAIGTHYATRKIRSIFSPNRGHEGRLQATEYYKRACLGDGVWTACRQSF